MLCVRTFGQGQVVVSGPGPIAPGAGLPQVSLRPPESETLVGGAPSRRLVFL